MQRLRRYCSLLADEEAKSGSDDMEMSSSDFAALIEDSRLIGRNGEGMEGELTIREVLQAFAGAQGEEEWLSEPQRAQTPQHSAILDHSLKMNFPEFIEGIIRVAFLKYESEGMPLFDKIKLVCESVMKCVPRVQSTANCARRSYRQSELGL